MATFDETNPQQETADYGRSPIYQNYGDEFMKEILETEEFIDRFEHLLRGEWFDDDKGKWVQKYKPRANELGINILIQEVRARIHKHTFLTNLSEEDVKVLAHDAAKAITDLLLYRTEDYGINNSDLTDLKYQIMFVIYTALKRAYQQGERRAIFASTQRHETVTYAPEQSMAAQPRKKKWFFF